METEIKIIKIEKRSNFIGLTAELEGQVYEGVLISKGNVQNENGK